HGAPGTGLGQVGTWSLLQTATNDGTFGDIAISPNGGFMLVYQEQTGEAPSHMWAEFDPDGLGSTGFTTIDMGMTNVGDFDFIPPQPDRSVDAEMNLAWDRSGGAHNGRVYLVYTDETTDESNDLDIFIRYSDNNGSTWSAKQ